MPPRRWSRRATPRVAAKPPTALPGYTPEDQVLRLTCALCAREARGFGYIHQLRIGEFPHYRFCSMACSKAGSALARRMGGMIDKTPLEEAAIKAARRPLAEVLQELGLLVAFPLPRRATSTAICCGALARRAIRFGLRSFPRAWPSETAAPSGAR